MLHARSRHAVHKTVVKKKAPKKPLHARSRHHSTHMPGIAMKDAWKHKAQGQGQGHG